MSSAHKTGKPLVERRMAVLVFLVLAGLAVGFANIVWFTSSQSTVTGQAVVISVTGHQGAPAISATALVSVAAALFLALSGRIAHWVAIVVLAFSGITIAGSALSLLLNPAPVVSSAAADAISITVSNPQISGTIWGYLTAVFGVGILVTAVACAASVQRWTVATSKYERPINPGTVTSGAKQSAQQEEDAFDDRDAWDALSSGIDPTQDSDPTPPVAQ